MTESLEELQRIRRALLDAAAADYHQALAAAPADVPPSRAYRRWRRRLLRNPQGLLRQQARPPWARALRGVACAVLALSLTFGAVMMVSPEARAAVSRWFFREEDTYTAYQFHGDISQDPMPRWVPTNLPEGYTLLHREDFGTWVEMVYADEHTGQTLQFCYQRLSTGGGWSLTNRNTTRTEVSVCGHPGHLYTAQEGSSHTLVWFDQESGYSFLLSAQLPVEELLAVGEGVTQKE